MTYTMHGHKNGTTSSPSLTLADALVDAPDAQFSEELPQFVRQQWLSPVFDLLEHPGILHRLRALPDKLLTATILALATPDSVGLDILFDERLLPRYAAIGRGHLRASFLPALRQLPGFCERDWIYDVRHAPTPVEPRP